MKWFSKRRNDAPGDSSSPPIAVALPTAPPPGQGISLSVAPVYWLGLSKAYDATQALGASEKFVDTLFEFPILALPEFPAAIEAIGRATGDAADAKAFAALAGMLREKLELLRQAPQAYATMADLCGRRLGNDGQGDRRINLHYAAQRFAEAAACYGDNESGADALGFEALACSALAETGVDERANLERVLQLTQRARAVYGAGPKADDCLQREARAQDRLKDLEGEPSPALRGDVVPDAYWLRLARLTGALDAFTAAKDTKELLMTHPMVLLPELPLALDTAADGTTDERVAAQLRNLSLELAKLQLRHQDDTNVHCITMIGCAVELTNCQKGEPLVNLRRAVEIFGEIRAVQSEGTIGARGRISEAIARQLLAEFGVDTHANLEKALHLCRAAAEVYGPEYEVCQGVEAKIQRQLACQ